MVTRSVAASTHNTDKERPIIDDFIDKALDDLPRGSYDGLIDGEAVMVGLSPIFIIKVLNSSKSSTPRPVTGSHPGAAEKP